MDDLDEPAPDLEGILLTPTEEGVQAVCNPAVFQHTADGPWPFLYRCIKSGDISVINLRQLLTPTELSKDYRTIIEPTEEYESQGCEDPGLVKINGDWYIPYVGWDYKSARICLATTKNFEKIKKWGVIGPQIQIQEGIELVPEKYKKILKAYLKRAEELKQDLKQVFVWDKDPAIDYNPLTKKWVLIHRIDPHAHIAIVDSLDELIGEKGKEYWRDHFQNLDKHVFMENKEPWENEKIGFACFARLGDKTIGIYHGVNAELDYSGGICEVDPKSYTLLSKMRDPVLIPDRDIHIFKFKDESGEEKKKKVIFPKGTITDEKTRRLYIYSGIADTYVGFRSLNIDWLYRQLNNSHNRLDTHKLKSVLVS